jgi:hypothetical protein
MKKELHPTVVILILAVFALCLGGYIYCTQSSSGNVGPPGARMVGGKRIPALGGVARRMR